MSYLQNYNTILITCKGTTETTFVGASFRASVTTHGNTGPTAKEAAKKIIANIRQVIVKHATSAGIDMNHIKATFEVDVHRNREGRMEGYKSLYTTAFKAKNVAEAIALHDDLTSLEGVEAPTPNFLVDDSPEVQDRAFADAVSRVERKFKDQSRALALNADNYHAQAWGTPDENRERGGKTLSITNSADDKPISVEPGKALYEVTLTVAYARKSSAPSGPQPA